MTNSQQALLLQLLDKHIIDNLEHNVSLKMLAELTHYNPTYLSRLYRKMAGRTLASYVQEKKIERSVYLLENTQLNISGIAKTIGYKSTNCFSKFFKRNTGMTPSEYRFFYNYNHKARIYQNTGCLSLVGKYD